MSNEIDALEDAFDDTENVYKSRYVYISSVVEIAARKNGAESLQHLIRLTVL